MTFLQQNWMLLFTMFASGALLLWPIMQRRASGLVEIGTLRATQLLNNNDPIIVDVRETREFKDVKVKGATHIPASQMKDRASQIGTQKDLSRPIVIVDARGVRGRGAGVPLKKAGFAEIYFLNGGLQAWRDAGLPVEKVS
jgi:rhodanese-related sulfurtransferase